MELFGNMMFSSLHDLYIEIFGANSGYLCSQHFTHEVEVFPAVRLTLLQGGDVSSDCRV